MSKSQTVIPAQINTQMSYFQPFSLMLLRGATSQLINKTRKPNKNNKGGQKLPKETKKLKGSQLLSGPKFASKQQNNKKQT